MGFFPLTFSLLFLVKKLVLSFAERKGENFFVFQKMLLTSAFSLSLFHTLNMHNKLSRKRLRRGLDGEQETSYLPSRKTIKTNSTDLSKSVTPPCPTLGKWETLHSHKTQHPCKSFFFLTIWYSSFLSRLLNLQLMLLRFINPYFLGAFSSHSRAAMHSHSLVTPLLSNTNSSDTCSDTTWTLISILNWSEIRFSLQWNNKVICAFFTFSFSKLSNTAFSLAAGLHLIRSSYLLTVNSRNIYTRNNSACIGNTTP